MCTCLKWTAGLWPFYYCARWHWNSIFQRWQKFGWQLRKYCPVGRFLFVPKNSFFLSSTMSNCALVWFMLCSNDLTVFSQRTNPAKCLLGFLLASSECLQHFQRRQCKWQLWESFGFHAGVHVMDGPSPYAELCKGWSTLPLIIPPHATWRRALNMEKINKYS